MTTIPNTTPYAWPYDGILDPARVAVLRILSGDTYGEAGPARDRADEVVDSVRRAGGAVVIVITAPPPRAAPMPGPVAEAQVRSSGIDGFYGSPLDAELRSAGLDTLILVGTGLETCIHSTMRSANDRGYECLLVLDACLAHDPGLVDSSRSQIEMSGGIFGAVASAGDVCAVFNSLETLTPERSAS